MKLGDTGGRSGREDRRFRPAPPVASPAAAASAAALALVLALAPLNAQAVRGQLVDQGNGFPIGGAFVVLLDQGNQEAARVLTGPDGTFLLRAPAPGTYRLQSKRIGFRISESPPLTLAEGETIGYRLRVQAVPARLPPVIVEGRPQCGTRGEEGTAVARLWEEAREALAAVQWTTGQRALRYTVELFERDFGTVGDRVLKEQRSSRSGYGEKPFKSIPGEVLVSRGYVVLGLRDTVDYFAPDAEVLLGDGFVNTHCFNAREGGNQHRGLVGLVFEPAPQRSLPDVGGTLWIERSTLELRFLDFTYAKLPWQLPEGALGGHVEFMRLPSGAWIVKHWWIRMALMGRIVYRGTGRPDESTVLGFRQAGGEVVTITAGSGQLVFSAVDAILEGTVVDSSRGGLPLPQATVWVEGVERRVTTDEGGQFTIAARLEGEYGVGFRHPRLDSLAFTPAPTPVRLIRGRRATVTLAVPPESVVTERLCPGGLRETERVIVGTVRQPGTTAPAPGAEIRAEWQAVSGRAAITASDMLVSATTNESGSYVLCGIPEDERVTIGARGTAGQSSRVILDFSDAGVWIDQTQYRSLAGRIWKQDLQLGGRTP